MKHKEIDIDGEKIQLVEVSEHDNKILYRFESDSRIVGADWEEVTKNFPDYLPAPFEVLTHDYLIETDGKIQFYEPDGTPFDADDFKSSEE